jgi:diguanylate cyclase (GGDEF)-like protein
MKKLTIHVSNILTSNTNYNDLVSIFTNSEFCIILKKTDETTAVNISQRLQSEVQKAKFMLDYENVLKISISIGVLAHQEDSIEDTLDQADMMLYKAKERGFNELVYY